MQVMTTPPVNTAPAAQVEPPARTADMAEAAP